MSLLRSTLLVALLAPPTAGAAQESVPPADSTPFRGGQWAMQLTSGLNLTGFGMLHFSSPVRAMLLDVQVVGSHTHSTIQDTSGTVSSYTSYLSLNGRLGRRSYQGSGGKAATFHTFGLTALVSHNCGGAVGGSGGCINGWGGGAFADFGGAYLVTPHLSLGGSIGAAFTYQRSSQRYNGPVRHVTTWSYNGSLSGPVFVAAFYF